MATKLNIHKPDLFAPLEYQKNSVVGLWLYIVNIFRRLTLQVIIIQDMWNDPFDA